MSKTPAEALDIRFVDPDSGDDMTIRAYFKRQLATLWEEGESFSGKRPFGNSGWEGYLEEPLVLYGFIGGEVTHGIYNEETRQYEALTAEEYAALYPEVIEEGNAFREVEVASKVEYEEFVQDMIEAL